MGFLDALRGVAVGLVVLQHIGQHTSSAFRELCTDWVQLGQLGVMVFFLCSGFIIPATIERNDSLKTFWISRFFRLYPLYWLSLLGAGALAVAGTAVQGGLTARDWAANATMVQALLGSPHAIGVYWSLAFEMVFYLAISGLFLLGVHRRSVQLALAAAGGAMALSAGCALVLDRPVPLGVFDLVTMFTGTVLYRCYAGIVPRQKAALCVGVSLLSGAVVLWAGLHGHEDATELGARSLRPMALAWLGAYLVFCVGAVLWHRGAPRLLRRLGLISYSVYLMQGLVFVAIPATSRPWLTAATWAVVIVALSTVTYAVVERPAIARGRVLVARVLAHRETASSPVPVSSL